ncbi:MAG: hypothetical protein HGA45_40250 [Chloroflexales bacterium]|nr:hypothetical protein [Chloroflexales bacterium]
MAVPFSPSLPGRSEFGYEHYRYLAQQQQREWVGTTRTLRPAEGETGAQFRVRVDSLVASLPSCGIIDVTVDEEIRAGVVVQATIRIAREPEPSVVPADDLRVAKGRPSGPRGSRGGAGGH